MAGAHAGQPALRQPRTVGAGARLVDAYRVELAMLGALILLSLGLSIFASNFTTEGNLRNVLWQVTAIGIIAIGQTLVILTAGIDLSVGGIVAFAGMAGGLIMKDTNVTVGILATLGVGLGVGLVNGLFVAYGRLAPFIVTLGTLSITTSLTYVVSHQRSITGLPRQYRWLGRQEIGGSHGVQWYTILFVGLFVLGHVVLVQTKLGRFIYAIGSNEEAARLSGVDVRAYTVVPYAVTGLLCAVAAMILSGRLGVIDPDTGQNLNLTTIAAVVIGGTSLFGGKGSLVGTLIGVFLIGVLNNGLNLLRVSSFWQGTAVGVVIILAVLLERVSRRRA